MSSWRRRAWDTFRIGRRSTGHHNLDLIIGQGFLRMVRARTMSSIPVHAQNQSPIIIAGLPRTGTTFLQRFLHEQQFGVGQTLYDQLFPSPILQRIFRPVLPLLEYVTPTRHHAPEIHKTGLMQVETDEASLFFQHMDGFFLYAFFWAFDEEERLPFFDVQNRNETQRDFAWLSRCWALRSQESTLPPLAKLFHVGAVLPELMEFFPQARVIYTARDPREVIPSTLSLLRSVLKKRYAWDRFSKAKQFRYYRRITDALIELMARFHRCWSQGGIDKTKCLVVPYGLLKKDFDGVMLRICDLIGEESSRESLEKIHMVAQKQKKRESHHRYRLEEFGLNASELMDKTSFFYPYWQPSIWEEQ